MKFYVPLMLGDGQSEGCPGLEERNKGQFITQGKKNQKAFQILKKAFVLHRMYIMMLAILVCIYIAENAGKIDI